jgi:hypothetical protein
VETTLSSDAGTHVVTRSESTSSHKASGAPSRNTTTTSWAPDGLMSASNMSTRGGTYSVAQQQPSRSVTATASPTASWARPSRGSDACHRFLPVRRSKQAVSCRTWTSVRLRRWPERVANLRSGPEEIEISVLRVSSSAPSCSALRFPIAPFHNLSFCESNAPPLAPVAGE